MDMLAIPFDQVWVSSSSTAASTHSMAAYAASHPSATPGRSNSAPHAGPRFAEDSLPTHTIQHHGQQQAPQGRRLNEPGTANGARASSSRQPGPSDGSSSRPAAAPAAAVLPHQLNSSSSSSEMLFEPLDAGTRRDYRRYRDQHALPGVGQAVPALHRHNAADHQHRAVTLPPAAPTLYRSHSTSSSPSPATFSSNAHNGSSSASRLLHRQSSSASSSSSSSSSGGGSGFFSSFSASHLLSSLSALSGLSLLSSSPSRGTMSGRGRPVIISGRQGSLRAAALLRSPALLDLSDSNIADSYDDLLALDQFNVKRAVKPEVLAALPSRHPYWPHSQQQQQQQCFICLESWAPAEIIGAQEASGAPAAVGATVTAELSCNSTDAGCRCCSTCRYAAQEPSSSSSSCGPRGHASLAGSVHASSHRPPVMLHVAAAAKAEPAATGDEGCTMVENPAASPVQQQGLGCWGAWGSGLFRLEPDEVSTAAVAAAPLTPPAATAAAECSISCSYSSCRASKLAAPGAGCAGAACGSAVRPAEPAVVIQRLPCGHEYCAPCIGCWLKEHATCPICRWTFPEEDTHLININK